MLLKFKESVMTDKPNKKLNKVKFTLLDNDPDFDIKVTLSLESENVENLEKLVKKIMDKPVEMTLKNL